MYREVKVASKSVNWVPETTFMQRQSIGGHGVKDGEKELADEFEHQETEGA